MSKINHKYDVYAERVTIVDRVYSFASFTQSKINNIYQLAVFEGEFIETRL